MTEPQLPDLPAIQEALSRSPHGPMKAKELAQTLSIPTGAYRDFRRLLQELERTGQLYRNRGNRYAVPGKIHLVVGALRVTRSGDGFVVAEDPAETDVYVQSRHLDSAMDGDRVVVRVEGRPPGKNPIGRVLKILERGHPTLVGRYRKSRRFGFVVPLDRKLGQDVLVPDGDEGEARDGEVVVVRITHFGGTAGSRVGEVERVLGPMDHPGVDVLAILHGHGLPLEFPSEVEEAARDVRAKMDRPGEARVDCRGLHVFTIDPFNARDHDDALSIERLDEGLWEVGIHIADVSHFVEEGSPLDLEALRRGTSVYLVDQVVPMLPHGLSSDLCSLSENVDRLALSLFVRIQADGEVVGHRLERTWIRSRHSLTYEQVHGVLEGEQSIDEITDEAIRSLNTLAQRLRARRVARGSLDFDLPEARVLLDEEGIPMDIQRVVTLDSHRLIEDFMLLANEVVAQEAVLRKLPIPFRVHESPNPKRMEELREFLLPFGFSLPRGGVRPKKLQQILNQAKGRAEESLLSTVLLRSMSRARYSEENLGHFGLASEAYLHFTSPIRRYPDLMVHRVMTRGLLERAPTPDRWVESVAEVSMRSSERERVAQQAERDSIEMKKIEYMRRHLGEEFEGTVSSVTSFGFFVLLDAVFVEGLVHVSSLADDYYSFVPEAYALVGERGRRRFRLGDRVRVQVMRADKEERQIDFLLLNGGVGTAAEGAAPPRPPRPGSKAGSAPGSRPGRGAGGTKRGGGRRPRGRGGEGR